MESIKNMGKNVNSDLVKEYNENLKDDTFSNLVKRLKLNKEVGSLNSTILMDSVCELKNCSNCKGLYDCNNKVNGHYLYPRVSYNNIELVYVPCKYKQENDKLLKEKNNSGRELENARFKEIDVRDKDRVKVIKWIKNFYDNYDGIKDMKGLYLHGSFGAGKTYLIYALLNELKINKKVDFVALYFPEILRTLKDNWSLYGEKIDYYCTVPLLLIDDIGAESVSEWGRDEVLGTILQSRMNNKLATFFTSNLTMEELENHLSLVKSNMDHVKARRIIERIKQLTVDMEMISENKRD